MINCRILKQVLVLNEEKNFARAAKVLHLSQPTLTRNLQALEQKLAHQIFDRAPRSLQLTPFGKLIVRHAKKIVSASTQLENEIAQFSNLQSGQLKLGMGPFPAETSFSQAIGLFNEQFPKIHIKSTINNLQNLNTALLKEKIEFFVAEISELENESNLDITPLQSHSGFFYCRADHPILDKKKINLKDCMQYSMILPKLPKRVADIFNANSSSYVQNQEYAYIECDNVSMSNKIVLNSSAIGIGIYDLVSELLTDKRIKIIPFQAEFMKTIHGIVKLKQNTLSPAAEEFIKILIQVEDGLCIEESHYFSNTLHSGSRK
jgi:DNA-binding transcriptional LysR family regulator